MKFLKGKLDIGKTTDNLLSKLDDSKFTEQEKAEYNKGIIESAIDFYKLTLGENTIRSKTRRNLAHIVVANTYLLFWLCIVIVLIGKSIAPILELVKEFKIGIAFIMVLGFFFGVHLLRSYMAKK